VAANAPSTDGEDGTVRAICLADGQVYSHCEPTEAILFVFLQGKEPFLLQISVLAITGGVEVLARVTRWVLGVDELLLSAAKLRLVEPRRPKNGAKIAVACVGSIDPVGPRLTMGKIPQ